MSNCENRHDFDDECLAIIHHHDNCCNNSFNDRCDDFFNCCDPWCEPWSDPWCDPTRDECCERKHRHRRHNCC